MLIKRKGICREVSERDFPKFQKIGYEVMQSEPTKDETEEKELTKREIKEKLDDLGVYYAERWGKGKLLEVLNQQ